MADNVAYIYDPGEQETYQIDSESLRYELERGALPATGQQIAEFKARDAVIKKHGTVGQSALGAAEQLASTLTFGGSRVLERLAGVDVEAMQGREEASPNLNVAAQVVGAIAPAVVSGGSSLFLQGAKAGAVRAAAEATAPALATRLGEGVAGLVLPSAGAGILRKTGATALGSAAEGALAGAGEIVDEAALGNPDLNAAALAHVGGGALLGGAAGGGLQFGGSALVGAARLAKRAGEKGFTKVLEAYPQFAKVAGYDDAVVDALHAQRREMSAGKSAFDVIDEVTKKTQTPDLEPAVFAEPRPRDFVPGEPPKPVLPKTEPPAAKIADDARTLASALDEQDDAVDAAVRQFFGSDGVEQPIRAAERKVLNAAVDREAAEASAQAVLDDFDKVIKKVAKDNDIYGSSASKILSEMQERIREQTSAGTTADTYFEVLDTLKRDLGKRFGRYGRDATDGQRALTDEIRALNSRIKKSLEDETVWNQTAVRQKAVNDAYSELTSADRDYRKLFTQKLTKPSKGKEYAADPGRLETFLKDLGKTKDDAAEKVLARKQVAVRNFLDEVKRSADVVPNDLDAPLINSAMARASSVFDDARASARQRIAAAQEARVAKAATKAEQAAFAAEEKARAQAAKGAQSDFKARGKELSRLEKERIAGEKAAFKEADKARGAKVQGLADAVEGPENFGVVPGAGMLRQTGARALDMAGVAGVMVHPMLGIPYGLYKLQQFLRSPAKVFRTLGHIERAGQTLTNSIEQHAGRLISGTAKAADVGRRGIVVSSRKDFAKLIGWLDTVAADPQVFADELDRSSEGLEAAPNTQQAFISRQVRAVAFLASKRPVKPDFGPFNPGEPEYSAMEMAKFDRYVQALQDPLSVMVQAANGSLTQEAVEAVETVDPVLFERMQMAVLESIAEHGGTVPRKSQGAVSMLLKQPASVIYTPDFIRRTQESYAGGKAFGSRAPKGTLATQPPPATAPNPSAEALDVGKRTATSTQVAGKY